MGYGSGAHHDEAFIWNVFDKAVHMRSEHNTMLGPGRVTPVGNRAIFVRSNKYSNWTAHVRCANECVRLCWMDTMHRPSTLTLHSVHIMHWHSLSFGILAHELRWNEQHGPIYAPTLSLPCILLHVPINDNQREYCVAVELQYVTKNSTTSASVNFIPIEQRTFAQTHTHTHSAREAEPTRLINLIIHVRVVHHSKRGCVCVEKSSAKLSKRNQTHPVSTRDAPI